MVEIFTVTFEVGGDTPAETFTGLFTDLGEILHVAHELATQATKARARDDARRAIAARAAQSLEEAERTLVAQFERFDVPAAERERALNYQRSTWAVERERALLDAENGAEQRVAEFLPGPYRFRSVRYENPLIVEILSEAGFATMSLALLLRIVRDWSPARRQAKAAATDAESRTLLRAELRRLLCEQVRAGELTLTTDAIDSLISDSTADSANRLSIYEPVLEQRQIEGSEL